MSLFLVPVVKDVVAEMEGIESMVGQPVEVVKKIPKYSRIQVSTPGMGKPQKFPTNKDVYLVNAPKSRWMRGKNRCEPVIVMFEGYTGNDVYSAEELGV